MARTFEAAFAVAGKSAIHVLSFSESHELGVPAEVSVDFLLSDCEDIENLVGQSAQLAFACDGGGARIFVGIVEAVAIAATSARGPDDRTFEYSVRVVSLAGLLARTRETRIFQSMDVRAIVAQVLVAHGIASDQQDWKLTGSYPTRDYCVQYQESSLAFISRLLEQEGIFFGSRFDEGKPETLFFADDSTLAVAIDGDSTLPFRHHTQMQVDDDHVHRIGETRALVSDKFVLRDFNFEKPMLDLTCEALGRDATSLEVYDYPGGYLTKGNGTRLATVRMEAEEATKRTVVIGAECNRISTGRKLTLSNSGNLDADGDYFVVGVTHDYRYSKEIGRATYSARATLVAAGVKYRPPRVTPRPVIAGPQTARVVCPAGSRPEEIHTDPHGRAKVKFHWDLSPDQDDKATFWMRVSQLQASGSMILPRLDWEVIVEFLEGDPDRPIVTGRLYNGQFMPPYSLPEGKTRTAIKSVSTPGGGGSNEIRLEDRAGAEEIMIHSQYDTKIAIANNKTKNVGNSETQFVKVNSKTTIGADQTIKITKGSENQITGNRRVDVGGNRAVAVNAVTTLNVKGSSSTKLGGNQMEMVGNPLEAILALALERAAEIASAKADQALQHIEGAIQGKVDQVMGPINALTKKAEDLGAAMKAVGNGDLGAIGPLLGGAAALPTAAGVASGVGGGGDSADGGGGAPAAASDSASTVLHAAATSAIQKGIASARTAIASAVSSEIGGSGDGMANAGGPSGAVSGVDETDRSKGPGHTTAKVGGMFSETVGVAKVIASVNGVITNVASDTSRTVGAAHVKMTYGTIDEAVGGTKTETALGLVVVAKGDENEAVTGSRTGMVGGAVFDLVGGDHNISADAAATFIGAFHKIEAESSITFKCGESSVTLDGSSVTIKSLAITFLGAKQQLTKSVEEVG